ncbi:MAG: carboxypeptidase regulatory-like domain-containing protein [Planctomycetes bacterium]|nr:carboxypeptidase regulatory-like domain-containing protein [Planctomycetota bacterium]
MNRKLLPSIAVVIALLAGFGLYAWLARDTSDQPPAAPTATANGGVPNAGGATSKAPDTTSVDIIPTARREPVPADRATPPQPPSAQGLRGLVLDRQQRPLRDIDVHLIESASNDPLALPMQQQRRRAVGPLASTRSGDDGSFAIGLPTVQDKVYELFLVSPRHAIAHRSGLRLLPNEWHDLGAIELVPGAVLTGRVTVEGHPDIPVPEAQVQVDVGTAFDDAARRSLPNGDNGLGAVVDHDGRYEIHHVPRHGLVRVRAFAPGFARAQRNDIELRDDAPAVVDFALAPGLGLRGRVVDDQGLGVAAARIEAQPIEMAGDALIGNSDAYGQFEVLGLVKGNYRLRVLANGFETELVPGVAAGAENLHIALTPRTVARVLVRSPTGTVLRSYRLGLRRYFAEQGGQVGLVVDVPDQRVRLDGATDLATVPNVPTGVFVLQVEAEGFAKTLSPPFACGRRDDATPAPVVEVTMQIGGTLRGIVLDELGAPLVSATVATLPAGADPDNPLFKMVAGSLADRITTLQVTTGSDGAFVLPQLAHGDYQLSLDHDHACRTLVRGIRIDQDGAQDLGTLRLPIGAEVTGHATLGGRVAGQMKVVLSSPATAAPDHPNLRLETITDANGVFRLPRRVPPGTYELRAAVAGDGEPDAQIFHQLLQLQRSMTTVVVLPGDRRVERDIDLPNAR